MLQSGESLIISSQAPMPISGLTNATATIQRVLCTYASLARLPLLFCSSTTNTEPKGLPAHLAGSMMCMVDLYFLGGEAKQAISSICVPVLTHGSPAVLNQSLPMKLPR